jgi:hypothetical protein
VDVIDMTGEVAVIADGVLPEPALPQRIFAFTLAGMIWPT